MTLWSGRVGKELAPEVWEFLKAQDAELLPYDCKATARHARRLAAAGILTDDELAEVVAALDAIESVDPADEDVHSSIERQLGPLGRKIHAGRSRNDQVAAAMRLYVEDACAEAVDAIRAFARVVLDRAEAEAETPMPGYTHLQRAQPVYFAHHLLAYVEMLERDSERLKDSFKRVNVCPLGSGANAGSTLPLDRKLVARLLGFVDAKGRPQLTQNSMDAVSDRDFAVEFCCHAALLAVHLSRLAEDVILWASSEFNFIKIADAYTTGSSLMPQKKNPDIAELTRGKTGRVIGNLVSLLTLLKGLPMTYNRDLQEDKERLFDTTDTVRVTARLMAAMLGNTAVNAAVCNAAASDPTLLATDLADYVVRKGVPFRQAHHIVGAVVALAEKARKPLDRLTLEELQSVDKHFTADALKVFDLKQAMARRNITGAPGTKEVRRQLARWRKILRA